MKNVEENKDMEIRNKRIEKTVTYKMLDDDFVEIRIKCDKDTTGEELIKFLNDMTELAKTFGYE